MKKLLLIAALASASVAGAAVIAESQPAAGARAAIQSPRTSVAGRVATLKVINVGCISCAPMVKRGLSRVPGVKEVSVKEGSGPEVIVRVVYDHKKVTPARLAAVTTNAGYSAQVVKN